MRRQLFIFAILAALCATMSSCNLFGLEYAYSFENEPAPALGQLNFSTLEFFRIHSDGKFSLWYEAILHAEMEDVYEADSMTFFVLDDTQFAAWLISNRYSCVEQIPKKQLQYFLKSYAAKGHYPSGILTQDFITAPSLNEDYTFVMRLYPTVSTASQNLHGMQVGWKQYEPDYYRRLSVVVTSNIHCTTGYIHILNGRMTLEPKSTD